MEHRTVSELISTHGQGRGALIGIMEEIQQEHGYLPEPLLRELADKSSRSLVDIYGIATFYKAFTLKPRGAHTVTVCLGTACHVRGAPAIVAEFERCLSVQAGDTTPDGQFTLQTVACLGACALGPIVVADGRYISNVKTTMVSGILKDLRNGTARTGTAGAAVFPLQARCPQCNASLMDAGHAIAGHPSIRLEGATNGRRGDVRVSSIYGSHTVEAGFSRQAGEAMQCSCPHCHASLNGRATCTACDAPAIELAVGSDGVLVLCSRQGCTEHRLDIGAAAAHAAAPAHA